MCEHLHTATPPPILCAFFFFQVSVKNNLLCLQLPDSIFSPQVVSPKCSSRCGQIAAGQMTSHLPAGLSIPFTPSLSSPSLSLRIKVSHSHTCSTHFIWEWVYVVRNWSIHIVKKSSWDALFGFSTSTIQLQTEKQYMIPSVDKLVLKTTFQRTTLRTTPSSYFPIIDEPFSNCKYQCSSVTAQVK